MFNTIKHPFIGFVNVVSKDPAKGSNGKNSTPFIQLEISSVT